MAGSGCGDRHWDASAEVTAKVLPINARCQCQPVIAMQFFSDIQGRTSYADQTRRVAPAYHGIAPPSRGAGMRRRTWKPSQIHHPTPPKIPATSPRPVPRARAKTSVRTARVGAPWRTDKPVPCAPARAWSLPASAAPDARAWGEKPAAGIDMDKAKPARR